MPSPIATTIYRYLRFFKMPVSYRYIAQRLQSHPDYPSLLSITETLDELGINNTAVQIEKEQLPKVPLPFLAHLNGNGGEFVIVNSRHNLDKKYKNFSERWEGVILGIENRQTSLHADNQSFLYKENKDKLLKSFLSVLLLALVITAIVRQPAWIGSALILVAIAGIFVSWMIVSRELGIENTIAEQVCGREAGCDSVIKSKAAKLFFQFGWSDIGITWFTSLFLLLIISFFSENSIAAYRSISLMSIASVPFTIFSVFYQWKIARKWCRLCMIVVGLLCIHCLLLLPVTQELIQGRFSNISFDHLLLSFTIILITSVVWFWIREVISEKKKLEKGNYAGLRLKNNAEIFMSLLRQQRTVDTTHWEGDLQIGNPHSSLQLVVACNPYCGPCAKAHQVLHRLGEKTEFGLTIRFTVNAGDHEDKKTQAVKYLLSVIAENDATDRKRQVLHDWFMTMDLDEFSKKYSLRKKPADVNEQLENHEEWMTESRIDVTPTIFINGYEMPAQYSVNDLITIIGKIRIESSERQNIEKNNLIENGPIAL